MKYKLPKDAWDTVESFLPNYYTRQDVLVNEMLCSKADKTPDNKKLQLDLYNSTRALYREAMLNKSVSNKILISNREDTKMGYSNYVRQSKDFTDNEWANIIADTKKMFAALPAIALEKGVPGNYGGSVLKIDDQEGNPPIADEKCIFFNGCGFEDADHETFELTKNRSGDSFSFCKTARKPYDLAVQACMLLAFHHAPNTITISSDGDADEWTAAVELLNSIGVHIFTMEKCVQWAALNEKHYLIKELSLYFLKEANNGTNL